MAMQNGVKLSQTSPAFLHANSTSHTWIFSAFAEIIDNAYDPDVSASELYIDKKSIHAKDCLVFTDNGNGMNSEKLHKMLSFGYCEKVEVNGYKPIGHYGNGFKSGSMRIGKDAIVFTKDTKSMSVGFLSQTFLRNVGAKTVLVPIVSYDRHTLSVKQAMDAKGSLEAITKHSIFRSSTEILLEFQALDQFDTGTRIIIYNLNRGADNKFELDFTSNLHDIINSEHQVLDMSATYRPVKEYQPEYRRSLREYCSILFLKPRMKIILRGKKVKTKLISQSLSRTEKDVYKPLWLNKAVKITFGFSNVNQKQDYGIMMYHRNRLIKAYERVGYQKQANELGVGVVGVVSVNFLEPIHNKQDFNKTDRYNATMNALSMKLNDYWNEKNNVIDIEAEEVHTTNEQLPPDWTWAQCDNCLKWRRLPLGAKEEALPEKWFCYMNPDPIHNRCDVEEEPEDEDELLNRATYEKTFKKYQEKGKQQTLKRKEKQLLIQEKELRLMRGQLETMRQSQEVRPPPDTVSSTEDIKPSDELMKALEVSSTEDIKPSVDELMKALEDMRRKEREQQKLIEELQKTKQSVLNKQQRLSQVVAEETANLAFLSKQSEKIIQQAKPQSSKQVSSSTSSGAKKRGSLPDSLPGKRVCMRDTDENFIVTANVSDDEADCIVLGSDDEDDAPITNKQSTNATDTQEDIKPDVNALNQQMAAQQHEEAAANQEMQNNTPKQNSKPGRRRPSEPDTPTPSRASPSTSNVRRAPNHTSPPKATVTPKRNTGMTVKFPFRKPDESPSQQTRSPMSKPNTKTTRGVQTLKMEEVAETESMKELKSLRLHVSQLLAIIAPDVDLGNLENIDEIVLEMIRVNSSQTDDSDEDSS